MSSRPLLKPQQVMTDLVADQNQVSLVTNINMVGIVSYNVIWENSVTGDFTVEVCNDYIAPVGVQDYQLNTGSWVPLALSTNVQAAGTADTALIDVVLTGASYIRLVFEDTSGGMGTGKINAWLAGKVA